MPKYVKPVAYNHRVILENGVTVEYFLTPDGEAMSTEVWLTFNNKETLLARIPDTQPNVENWDMIQLEHYVRTRINHVAIGETLKAALLAQI